MVGVACRPGVAGVGGGGVKLELVVLDWRDLVKSGCLPCNGVGTDDGVLDLVASADRQNGGIFDIPKRR